MSRSRLGSPEPLTLTTVEVANEFKCLRESPNLGLRVNNRSNPLDLRIELLHPRTHFTMNSTYTFYHNKTKNQTPKFFEGELKTIVLFFVHNRALDCGLRGLNAPGARHQDI